MRLGARWIVVAGAFLAGGMADGAVYKCQIDGKTVFRDRPCPNSGNGDNQLQLAIPQATSPPSDKPETGNAPSVRTTSSADEWLKSAEKQDKINEINGKISRIKEKNRILKEKMNHELANLRFQKGWANNNLAGATYRLGISAEMQVVTSKYDAELRSNDAEVDRLREDLAELNKN